MTRGPWAAGDVLAALVVFLSLALMGSVLVEAYRWSHFP